MSAVSLGVAGDRLKSREVERVVHRKQMLKSTWMLRPQMVFACVAWLALSWSQAAAAQDPESGDVELSERTELRTETRAETRAEAQGRVHADVGHGGGELRLAVQLRLDTMNVIRNGGVGQDGGVGDGRLSPLVTPGVRLLEGRLFLGLGLGYSALSTEGESGATSSRSGFTLVPMAMYDLIDAQTVSFALGGMLSLGSEGETENCTPTDVCDSENDDVFGWGLGLLAEVRAKPLDALGVGVDFGWGFVSSAEDDGDSIVLHGFIGMLVIETSFAL